MGRRSKRAAVYGKASPIGAKPSPHPTSAERWLHKQGVELGIYLFLALAVLAVFGRTVTDEFLVYDDHTYVSENRWVRAGLNLGGVARAFTHPHQANWHPLTTLSHELDCSLYGLWAPGHHLTNVLLHAVGSMVLFSALRRLTGSVWRSAAAAAFFSLHPLRVESVAWIAERKDLLSGICFGLTLWAYANFAQREFSWTLYLLVVVSFVLGLLCKPMLVTLPFVLLLLDYWPLGRWQPGAGSPDRTGWRSKIREEARGEPVPDHSVAVLAPCSLLTASCPLPASRLVAEKLPLLALSAASCVATFLVQAAAGAMSDEATPLIRLQTAVLAYPRYLAMTFWPFDLAVPYPRDRAANVAAIVVCGLIVAAISWAAVLCARRGSRYVLVGWFWFAGMLVPVSGVVAVGDQSVADRYTYLPHIGLFVAIVWGVADRLGRNRAPWGFAIAFVLLMACAATSIHQGGYWRNSETLLRHVLDVTRDNAVAHNNLGIVLRQNGRVEEEEAEFREALRIRPDYAVAHGNLGFLLQQRGDIPAAVEQYEAAHAERPGDVLLLNNLGVAMLSLNRPAEAEQRFEESLRHDPQNAATECNLGIAISAQGRHREALTHMRRAVDLSPQEPKWHLNLAREAILNGLVSEGLAECNAALRIKPDYVAAREELVKIIRGQDSRDPTETLLHESKNANSQ
jgi:protein O-mannosyl-transferase